MNNDDWKRFWRSMAIAMIALLGSEAFALILMLILSVITGDPICK